MSNNTSKSTTIITGRSCIIMQMEKILRFVSVLQNQAAIPKTGGVLFAGLEPQNVESLADHCYKVAYLSLLFGKKAQQHGTPINLENLLTAAITHDWSESIILDLPSNAASFQSYFEDTDIRAAVKKAEHKAMKEMEEYLNEEVKLQIGDGTLSNQEKDILDIADITAMLLEIIAWKYKGLQYEWFDYVWSNTLKRLQKKTNEYPVFIELPIELEKTYRSSIKPVNLFLTKSEFQSHKN